MPALLSSSLVQPLLLGTPLVMIQAGRICLRFHSFHLCSFECFLCFVVRYWEMKGATSVSSGLVFEVLLWNGWPLPVCTFSDSLPKTLFAIADSVSLVLNFFFVFLLKRKPFWTSLVEQTNLCMPAQSHHLQSNQPCSLKHLCSVLSRRRLGSLFWSST